MRPRCRFPAGLNFFRKEPGVGKGGGGRCTCPDGRVFNVGDVDGACKQLACEGGSAGKCSSTEASSDGAGMKVTCARPDLFVPTYGMPSPLPISWLPLPPSLPPVVPPGIAGHAHLRLSGRSLMTLPSFFCCQSALRSNQTGCSTFCGWAWGAVEDCQFVAVHCARCWCCPAVIAEAWAQKPLPFTNTGRSCASPGEHRVGVHHFVRPVALWDYVHQTL